MKPFLFASLLAAAVSAAASEAPLIQTAYGDLSGVTENGMHAYLGVPYAKPPVGNLRWMPPEAPAKWEGVLKADHHAERCLQKKDLGSFSKDGGSEDCLYLNVYTDENADPKKKRPVFVWIHGGAILVGSGSDYNPEFLVKDGGAVVVTFNYRLGALGFLSEKHLDSEKKSAAVNYGSMDQTAVLRWVKENIAAFGGDPENVTISGESSGGTSVFTQIAAPSAAGLFHKAVAMSGSSVVNAYPHVAAPLPHDKAQELGSGLAAALGCDKASDTASCMRSKPASEILAMQSPYVVRSQIIDGTYLPMRFSEAFEKGAVNRVTLINGSNRDEGDFFSAAFEEAFGKALEPSQYRELLMSQFGAMGSAVRYTASEKKTMDEHLEGVLKTYPLSDYLNTAEAFSAYSTDSLFSCSALRINTLLSKWMPVYAYEFSDRTSKSYIPNTSFVMRAAHTHEIPYIMRGFSGSSDKSTELSENQKPLSHVMVQVWTHPEAAEQIIPGWHRFDPARENFMTLSLPAPYERSGQFSREHKCSFWTASGQY